MNPGEHCSLVLRNIPHLAVHGWRLVHLRGPTVGLWHDVRQEGWAVRIGPAADDPLGQRVGQLTTFNTAGLISNQPVYPADLPHDFLPKVMETLNLRML